MLYSTSNCSVGTCKRKSLRVAGLKAPLQVKHISNFSFQKVQSNLQRNIVVKGSSSTVNLSIDRDLETPSDGFSSIKDALKDLANGKFVVVVDDENRENEGDLIINGDKMTTEKMAFMVEHTSGVVCMAMEAPDLKRIDLPLMLNSKENFESMYTAFTITVDADKGTTTGISASDRAITIQKMSDPSAGAMDFRRPGHIFPLRYKEGGVLIRPGHTEAGVDLARLSGSFPGSALCEIVDRRDGSMARTPELLAFAERHGLRCITIADLIRYRLRKEVLVEPESSASSEKASGKNKVLNTPFGPAELRIFKSKFFKNPSSQTPSEHVALVFGDLASASSSSASSAPLVALRTGNLLSDVFDVAGGAGALARFGEALAAERRQSPNAAGVLVYLGSGSTLPSQLSDLELDLESESAASDDRVAEMRGNLQNGSSVSGYAGLKTVAEATQILAALGVTAARVASVGASASEKKREAHLKKTLASCGVKVLDA